MEVYLFQLQLVKLNPAVLTIFLPVFLSLILLSASRALSNGVYSAIVTSSSGLVYSFIDFSNSLCAIIGKEKRNEYK